MLFDVNVVIKLKGGMLSPEAKAISHALSSLGMKSEYLNTAKFFEIGIDAENAEAAKAKAAEMCERLLANPVIHSYTIEVKKA